MISYIVEKSKKMRSETAYLRQRHNHGAQSKLIPDSNPDFRIYPDPGIRRNWPNHSQNVVD